jgi:aminoglycoside phosphotransferase (APT) family kinase protein
VTEPTELANQADPAAQDAPERPPETDMAREVHGPPETDGPRGAPGVDPYRLRAYLDEHRPGMVRGHLRVSLIAGGRSNLTYVITDGTGEWVLRRPPLGHVLPTAHDMGREYRVISALADQPVPVPRAYLLCTDAEILGAPFYVMERVVGTVYRNDEQLSVLDRGAIDRLAADLMAILARLHELDPLRVGLGDFGRPEGFMARQVRRWRAQLDASRSREVPGIDELHARLAASVPQTQRHSIVHGDYRLDNVIVGPDGRIAAVLDWEMATLGDPLADVGLLHVYLTSGARRSALLPPAAEMIRMYAAVRHDLDLSPLPWYIAFGCFKLAVVSEGIHYRFITGKTVGEGFDTFGDAVGPLVEQGLRALDGTPPSG